MRTTELKKRNPFAGNKAMTFMAIVFLAIVIAFVAGNVIVKAGSTYNKQDYQKCFTSICVEEGDTLWTIAEQYMDVNHYSSVYSYMNEVVMLNHLGAEDVHAGQTILVSYYVLPEE